MLNGPGTSPVELLAADPRAQFTAPNRIANRQIQAALSADYNAGGSISLQGIAHYGDFHQRVLNGNAPNDTPCADGARLLCDNEGNPSRTVNGATIPDFLNGGPYGELDRQETDSRSYGVAMQVADTAAIFGLPNHLVAGLDFDGASTKFAVSGTVGGLTGRRVFAGPGVVIDEPGQNVPSRLRVLDVYYGAFVSDTLDLTSRLTLTTSGRFNLARIDLRDESGGDLSGNHRYDRFNPAIGASWRVLPRLTAYAGYAEANRTPTPAELSCASPTDACSLANFFSGDPSLKQVVARSVEAGIRGRTTTRGVTTFTYSLSLYRTTLDDDIAFENVATLGRAFFQNVGQTRRQGLDASFKLQNARWLVYAEFSHIDATYQVRFTEAAGNNPAGDTQGLLRVMPGDRLPGVPRNILKFGACFSPTPKWTIGAVGLAQDGAVLSGDPSNQTPRLPAFFRLDLDTKYQITTHLQLFARIANATVAHYYTFGTFSPTAAVFLAQAPGASDPRAYSPAAPLGAYGGVKMMF